MKGISDSSGLLRLANPPSMPGSFGSPVLNSQYSNGPSQGHTYFSEARKIQILIEYICQGYHTSEAQRHSCQLSPVLYNQVLFFPIILK